MLPLHQLRHKSFYVCLLITYPKQACPSSGIFIGEIVIQFADEAVIEVRSGKGGNGCVAFRRESMFPWVGLLVVTVEMVAIFI